MTNQLFRLALAGALTLGAASAVAAPVPDPMGAPAKNAPGGPPPAARPAPETPPAPSRGVEPKTVEGRPSDPTTAQPASPSGILSERDIPGRATPSTLTPKQAQEAQKLLRDLHKTNELEIALGSLGRERTASDAIKEYAKELVDSHQAADKKIFDYAEAHAFTLSTTTPTPSAARELPSSPDIAAPAGAATGMVDRKGVASAGNPGGAAAGNPHGVGAGSPGAAATGSATRPPSAVDLPPKTASDVTSPAPELDAEGRKCVARLEKLEGRAFDKQFLTEMVKGHSKTLGKLKAFQSRKLDSELASLVDESKTMVENHLARARELQRGEAASLPVQGDKLGALEPANR